MQHPHALYIETDLPPTDLRGRLQPWEPWAQRIEFSNGVSTAEFKRRVPFADNPLSKLALIEREIPLERFRGEPILDVGCNAGHNAFEMARRGARVTGIDFNPRHITVARFLSEVADVQPEFLEANAEEFRRDGFALVLHLGTLYHLPNPVRSLETARDNLRAGGTLVVETTCFDHPEDSNLCSFMHDVNNDPSNWWALSTPVLGRIMERLGFEPMSEIARTTPDWVDDHVSRVIVAARKP